MPWNFYSLFQEEGIRKILAYRTVLSYPGIDGMGSITLDMDNHLRTKNKSNVHGFKTTLAALKSTELISGLWQDVQVNGEDLVTVDSTISFFCALAAQAVSKPHLSTLGCLLKEWEGLFENDNQRTENKQIEETSKATGG